MGGGCVAQVYHGKFQGQEVAVKAEGMGRFGKMMGIFVQGMIEKLYEDSHGHGGDYLSNFMDYLTFMGYLTLWII